MKSKDELKEIDIKNRTYYYFDVRIIIFTYYYYYLYLYYHLIILLDEKLYENISFYDISYKTSMGLKTLSIWSDKRWIY